MESNPPPIRISQAPSGGWYFKCLALHVDAKLKKYLQNSGISDFGAGDAIPRPCTHSHKAGVVPPAHQPYRTAHRQGSRACPSSPHLCPGVGGASVTPSLPHPFGRPSFGSLAGLWTRSDPLKCRLISALTLPFRFIHPGISHPWRVAGWGFPLVPPPCAVAIHIDAEEHMQPICMDWTAVSRHPRPQTHESVPPW